MGRMRLSLCFLFTFACTWASEDEGRAKKPPFVVDAIGNALPPPPNVPASVGSPVNLLTPDRYEFYTFDESGELVKRLMTLKEIQAIVAAGEEAEGLVTFANDNQPTIAFNFSEPADTKIHSVVTNVKNILEAQKQAYENNPVLFPVQPTLDTPDVSNSWSLILPTVFGDTGMEIMPDKSTSVATQPGSDILNFNHPNIEVEENSASKEGNNQILHTTTDNTDDVKTVPSTDKHDTKEEISISSTTTKTTTTTTTTQKPSTTTTTRKITTTTTKPTTIKPQKLTTNKGTTIKTATTKRPPLQPLKFTTVKIPPSKLTTVKEVSSTTKQSPTTTFVSSTTSNQQDIITTAGPPRATSTIKLTTTTLKPNPTTKKVIRTTPRITTTSRPLITKPSKQPLSSTEKEANANTSKIQIQDSSISASSSEKTTPQYEKISTYIPVSTVEYITEKTTLKIHTPETATTLDSTTTSPVITTEKLQTTLSQKVQPAVTTYKPTLTASSFSPTTNKDFDIEKLNATTMTTQSVSPSITMSSTEFTSFNNLHSHNNHNNENKYIPDGTNNDDKEPIMPLFDVAQSISQIASDLGGNYMPIPTVSNIIDSTKLTDMESKENADIEIPVETESNDNKKNVSDNNENFVKISTLDPNDTKISNSGENVFKNSSSVTSASIEKNTVNTLVSESTTMDSFLSESMGDLLSQVVNLAPQPTLDSEKEKNKEDTTTEKNIEITTSENLSVITTTVAASELSTETDLKNEPSANDIPPLENKIADQNKSVEIEGGTIKLNSTTEETTSKEENNKTSNYVQISLSNENNSSFSTYHINTNSVSVSDNSDNNKNIPDKIKETIEINEDKTTKISEQTTEKIQSTSVKYVSTTTKPTGASSHEPITIVMTNKNPEITENNDKVDKIPELFPKIEDFKKKIQKVNIDEKELANERNSSWKLISTVSPPKANEIPKDKYKNEGLNSGENNSNKDIVLEFSNENQGLEVTTKDLSEDIAKFTELCNELAFRYWNAIIENIDKRRSFVLSPYSITSMLAMMFMGAKGSTSGEMNDILKLDDMVTFNPHFILKNISDSIETTPESGVIVSAFIRELYSDKNKGKILTFYKERAQHFYNGHVEEINFKLISDIIRRRTNLLVKRYTWGKIAEYMKANTITMNPPLAAFSSNIFQTDCTGSSVEGRDGEMYFVVSPTVRQRRLVPVPAVVYRSGFLAGYDPVLDATAAALGNPNSIVSTLFVMPGQQGNVVHAEDLEALEQRLLEANPTTPAWNRLLRTLLPRIGLELQIPRFSHKSIFNVSSTLKKMGLKDLFDADHADLGGLNGPSKDLYLSDMVQATTFVTCGEGVIGEQHHTEEYPESLAAVARRRASRWAADWDEPRDYQRAFHDPHDVGEAMHLPLHLRPRQARLPARNAQPARLKFDRPFLYFVRHNPSGMILYVGRYNPRLLP